ncbi:hypothetical protein L915_11522 [Phytophthora nicotianae]|uniref:Uncharacterized protein n=1 Tax=Phytophthora nicotianae TaxID=4792 RepID=W2GLN6_PHYNI|nr:hypothetical protein L915_11522 [Phytophthora nicotianae]
MFLRCCRLGVRDPARQSEPSGRSSGEKACLEDSLSR